MLRNGAASTGGMRALAIPPSVSANMTNNIRFSIFLAFWGVFQITAAQNCFCEHSPQLSESVSCDTVMLQSHAKLYNQFNCDSSWQVFENARGKRLTIFHLDSEVIDLTWKLGWHVWRDDSKKVLFVSRTSSGWPTSMVYMLIQKRSARVVKVFEQVIYACSDSTCDFILYMQDSSMNFMSLYKIDSDKEYKIRFPTNISRESLGHMNSKVLFFEQIFEEPTINGTVYTFPFYYEDQETKQEVEGRISIDLNKYRRQPAV